MDIGQARCEDNPSLAYEHGPSSGGELLINYTIAETNMALSALGRPGQL